MPRALIETTLFPPIKVVDIDFYGFMTTYDVDAASLGHYRSRRIYDGSTTPGFNSLTTRQKKKLSTLDHSVTIVRESGTIYREKVTRSNTFDGTVYGSRTHTVSDLSAIASIPIVQHLDGAYTKARAQLAEKVNNLSVNLAQAFGERKQTSRLLVSSANRILAAAVALKHGRLGDFQRSLSISVSKRRWKTVQATPIDKRISSHWLEYQYGWRPLIQDMYGVSELLSSHSQSDRYNFGNTGHGTDRKVDVASSQLRESMVGTVTSCKIGLTYRLDSASRAGLAQTGLSNPALLAWELLPYSFVVDWLLPVGNYLKALDAFSGFSFVDGWVAQRTRVSYVETRRGSEATYIGGNRTDTLEVSGSHASLRVKYNRSKLNTFPGIGKLSFQNPIGGDPASRVFTAVSLLRVLFK